MSSAELTRWMAWEQISGPIGQQRDDQLFALLAAVVSNANRGKGRKAKPKDFLPDWDRERGTSWEEQLAAVRDANRALGGEEEIRHADGRTTRIASHKADQPNRIRRRRR
ncbi:phage tail assembly protein T [Nocardiopsis synnemataformans]|uniref:phage tail assembly protein T n=1 Tax=Nocardiopsis synnemataformans TaxID=61305 RepID=UPI003EBAEAD5